MILEAYGDWNQATRSNHVILNNLAKGSHEITVRFNPEGSGFDNNMSFNKENWNDMIVETLTVARL